MSSGRRVDIAALETDAAVWDNGKSLSKALIRLRLHVTQVEAGSRPHPPHVHAGVEAFYVLEGNGTIEVEGERYLLSQNEAIVLDATVPHGLVNTGSTRMRYLVIITQ